MEEEEKEEKEGCNEIEERMCEVKKKKKLTGSMEGRRREKEMGGYVHRGSAWSS